jgi:hypothetical protein
MSFRAKLTAKRLPWRLAVALLAGGETFAVRVASVLAISASVREPQPAWDGFQSVAVPMLKCKRQQPQMRQQ